MVSFQSVHDAAQFPPEECTKLVDWLLEAFSDVGLQDVRGYDTPDGSVAVCGHADGPPGAPTVLLYFHHDVQPPLDEAAWNTPVWELTEANGRWYGRGAADCKGNIAVHLTALRALAGDLPVNVKIVGEGSEEQGTGGLEQFVPPNADLLRADAILVCDHRQLRGRYPEPDHEPARLGECRGQRGGAGQSDALRHVRRSCPRRTRSADPHAGELA
jgi:acetylornithine deacetylase/succinyl-diaminopimelate desuccinylase-like protein